MRASASMGVSHCDFSIFDGLANLFSDLFLEDAFFTARRPIPLELIETIKAALAHEQAIDLTRPTCRHVYPLRLEERGNLFYLHAYRTIAEANHTFRLDRVHEWHIVKNERPL